MSQKLEKNLKKRFDDFERLRLFKFLTPNLIKK